MQTNLSEVAAWLSQTGLAGLPYPEDDLYEMRQHITDTLQASSVPPPVAHWSRFLIRIPIPISVSDR